MSNDVIANYHSIKQDIIPPEKNTIIFSERERLFSNLVQTYSESEKILKKKILIELKYFFRDRKTLVYALENSRVLYLLLAEIESENDEEILILAIRALEVATRERLCKKLFIKNDGLISLKNLNEKSSHQSVLWELFRIIFNLSKEEDLLKILVEQQIFEILLKNLQIQKKNSFLVILNKIVANFLYFQNVTELALEYNLEDILIANCYYTSFGVINQSVFNLLLISYNDEGKKIITNKNIYQKLWKLFTEFYHKSQMEKDAFLNIDKFKDFSLNGSFCEVYDPEENEGIVDTVFLNLFSSIAQNIEAKNFFQSENAHKFVFDYIGRFYENEEILLSCILFLTNLAENHIVRKDLLKDLDYFKKMLKRFSNTQLGIFIQDLIDVIDWKP